MNRAVIARKQHTCSHCGGIIQPGDRCFQWGLGARDLATSKRIMQFECSRSSCCDWLNDKDPEK